MYKQTIEDVAGKISSLLPPAPAVLKQELEGMLRSLIQANLEKMDLVSREEFDIQSAVLQKTRIKLEALQQQVSQLEQQIARLQNAQSPQTEQT